MAKRLDVIIFGASGFTGKSCVVEAVSVLKNFNWGVAGRNKDKLSETLKYAEVETKSDLSTVPIVVADIGNKKSLVEMAEKAKVIVNCVGPYRFYGEQVVQACITAGTHHVDVSGEAQYMERMQLEYDQLAREKNIYIISACGYGSIPVDVGSQYLEQKFGGIVNSIESYMEQWIEGSQFGTSAHYGSWQSLIHAVANYKELKEIRAKLFKGELPTIGPELKAKRSYRKSPIANAYFLPFPGVDEPVVHRSQRLLYETENKRPVQVKCYMAMKSFIQMISIVSAIPIIGMMTQFACTRYLLLRFPKVMTLGFVSHEGPSKEMMKNTKFTITLLAEGWKNEENLEENIKDLQMPPNKKLMLKISGYNPGYGATSVALLVAATTILKESEKMPSTGGVYPPGAAFARTNMIEELGKYDTGYQFKIVEP